MQCEWKIRWGTTEQHTTQCAKEHHVDEVLITEREDGRYAVLATGNGDLTHSGPSGWTAGQTVEWQAGDRREYRGDWPGYCNAIDAPTFSGGCVLPDGHHGNCTP